MADLKEYGFPHGRLLQTIYNYVEEIGSIGSWTWNIDTDVTIFSDNMFRLFGMQPNEVKPDLNTISPFVHPDDTQPLLEVTSTLKEQSEPLLIQYRVIRKNKEERIFINKIKLIRNENDERVVIGITEDITERKKSEARQAFLLNLSDTLRTLADPLVVQQTAAKLLGEYLGVARVLYLDIMKDGNSFAPVHGYYNKIEPMPDGLRLSDFGDIILPGLLAGQTLVVRNSDTHPTFGAAEHAAYNAINVKAGVGIPLIKKNRLVAVFTAQQVDPHDWEDTEISLIEEVAERTWAAVERTKSEVALRNSEQQLKAALKVRDEFIGIASHELKTPVTSIKTYAEMVEENLLQKSDAKNARLVAKLNEQVDRMTNLITDLLDTTRIDGGGLIYHHELFNLNILVKERVEEMLHIAGSRQISFDLKEPAIVFADKERIGQVITNLVTNAVKYSPDKTEIAITSLSNENEIKVSIADKGIGIPKESLDKIFDRFYRVSSRSLSTYPGMGLGLYISSQIIKNHGGKILVNSEEGKGSVFHFTLPLKR